jgi:hypothetical protein
LPTDFRSHVRGESRVERWDHLTLPADAPLLVASFRRRREENTWTFAGLALPLFVVG